MFQGSYMVRKCPICSYNNEQALPLGYSIEPWLLKKCRNCGFVYLENPVLYGELIEKYAWEKTSKIESCNRKNNEPVIYFLSSLVKKFKTRFSKRDKTLLLIKKYLNSGLVCDIGCGEGALLIQAINLIKANIIPIGIEVSKVMSIKASERFMEFSGYAIHDNAIEGLNKIEKASVSGIIMSSFLEHEVNPKQVLLKSYEVLKSGGHVIIKVPNYGCVNRIFRGSKWCGFRFPDHVNYFTPKSLINIVEACNFTIGRFNLVDHFPTSDSMYLVIKKT